MYVYFLSSGVLFSSHLVMFSLIMENDAKQNIYNSVVLEEKEKRTPYNRRLNIKSWTLELVPKK